MFSKSKLQSIIWTSRIAEAEEFYRNVLGLVLKEKSDGTLVFDVNGSDLRVSPVPTTTPSEHTVLGFEFPDVDSIVTLLTGHGVEFERFDGFPHDENGILNTPGGSRVAWFRDPDGNLLSVVRFIQP